MAIQDERTRKSLLPFPHSQGCWLINRLQHFHTRCDHRDTQPHDSVLSHPSGKQSDSVGRILNARDVLALFILTRQQCWWLISCIQSCSVICRAKRESGEGSCAEQVCCGWSCICHSEQVCCTAH